MSVGKFTKRNEMIRSQTAVRLCCDFSYRISLTKYVWFFPFFVYANSAGCFDCRISRQQGAFSVPDGAGRHTHQTRDTSTLRDAEETKYWRER